ncbi:probable inactive receptor kinase At4g23740 isoform X1 [Phoenix dactylifera]|uniref:Probable inactive receptor kinase At4g23740 isoform X1 n=1 Tax=Phoenix dactylifera TaxID=42345 RepID=A0A8B7C7L1_PHODC|nr:probable inactive receptor kinase At4g23740 isoform X1 [Phoenix dactylifera]XP_008793471.2 probable inactive receptor kinase At4g23740 isoform X1 [Phoenix dactylifera]
MEEAKLVVSATAILLVCSAAIVSRGAAEPVEDKQALLDFISRVPPRRALNWSPYTSVCDNWRGVACSGDRARVVAVRLPGVGFNGQIPRDTLGRLTALQVLSLRCNGLFGPIPADFANLAALTGLHLQLNRFSGPLPSDLSAWKNLTVLDLSFNAFNGSIPASLSNLTQLSSLNLSNNSFSGEIPDLQLPNLQLLNLSNNHLNGSIPKSLQTFPNSSFSGNHLSPISASTPPPLPLRSPSPSPAPPLPRTKAVHRLGESTILAIIIGGCAVIFAVMALFLFLCRSNRDADGVVSGKGSKGFRSPEKAMAGNQDEINRLVFFEGCTFAFDLEDLLRASAEVLGKGTFGTAYKAVLEDATTVVVKRLKEVGFGKKEFEQQMEVVGSIKHENVVDLRAYYYSKDEKLVVYDYFSHGSVASLLHGKRGEDRTPLDWETRLKIAIGAARGIARIHTENNGKLVHGNIKSSNVFLNSQQYGCVSDLGLTSLMNPMIPPVSRTAGYRAPEVVDLRKATQASDVYSFGVLVLELLTGKSPIQIKGGGDEVVHLVRWVHSVVREEWTAEVFDVELMRYPNIEEEMVEMLQIAMTCAARMPDQRPRMTEVVRMLEDVRRFDTGNRPSSEASTPPKVQAVAETLANPQ